MKDDPETAVARELSWSVTIGATSDYVSRGYSQTWGDPAIQGSIDASYGIFYAGVWGSNVDFTGADNDAEIDLYLGIKPEFGPVTFDLGVLYYVYPGLSEYGSDTDYVELKFAANTTLHNIGIGGLIYYAPDYPGADTELTAEGSLSYTLPEMHSVTPTIGGAYGHVAFEGGTFTDYNYWNAGVTFAIDKLSIDLRYWDTDASGCTSHDCDQRFVASTKVTLP